MRFRGMVWACLDLARAIMTPTAGPKRCPRCERALPLEAFQRDRSKRDGLSSICADCVSAAGAKWYRAAPPCKQAAKCRHRSRYTFRDLERDRMKTVRRALSRGAAPRLAQGLTVNGRRGGWARPDRRSACA